MAFNKSWFDEVRGSIDTDITHDIIKDKANWPIFVYDFISNQPNTEAGLKPANSLRRRFYQWTEIIKGNTSIFLTPHGATTLNKHQGTGVNDPSYYDVKYSKEKAIVIKGIKSNNSGGNTFSTTSFGGFGDFTTIGDNESVEMKTTFKVGRELLTKFFFIPDVARILEDQKIGQYDQDFDDNDIYYIESYTNYYNENTGEFLYSEITFSNIQFNLQQSGQTIEQHIYLSSPGGGYLIPKLIFDNNGVPYDWEWNKNFIEDKGVKTIQIEVTGNASFGGIEIYGHPTNTEINGSKIDDDDNPIVHWYPPRKLAVENFALPLQEDFYKVSSNTNQYVLADCVLQVTSEYPGYNQMRKELVGDKENDYQGILITDFNFTSGTNSLGLTIQDRFFNVNPNVLPNEWKNGSLNTKPNQWFYDGYVNGDPNVPGIGQTSLDLSQAHRDETGQIRVKDIFNLMSFYTTFINRLPIELTYKLTWSFRDIPVFGGFANKVTFGMPFNWRHVYRNSNTLYPNLTKIPMLIVKEFYDMAATSIYASNQENIVKALGPNGWDGHSGQGGNQQLSWDLASRIQNAGGGTGQKGKIPVGMFQKNESDTIGAMFANKANTSTLTFKLTDKMFANSYDINTKKLISEEEPISTVMLNQVNGNKKYKVGNKSYFSSGGNGEGFLTDINGNKYVITGIGFRGLTDGDVRITCYSVDVDDLTENDNQQNFIVFQTYLQTEAQYKNNQIREWFTMLNTSYLDSLDKYLNIPFNWPEALPEPQPENGLKNINLPNRNISDFGVFSHQVGRDVINKPEFVDFSFNDKKIINLPSCIDSSLNIEIVDFRNYGPYTSKADILKDYEKININTSPISFALSRIYSSYVPGERITRISPLWGNDDGHGNNRNRELTSKVISDIVDLQSIKEWDGQDNSDINYYLARPLVTYTNNRMYEYRNSDSRWLNSNHTTNLIGGISADGGGYYYFYYFQGSKLYMKLFFIGEIYNMAYGINRLSSSTPITNATTMLLWIGSGEVMELGKNVPMILDEPKYNKKLFGNQNFYWQLSASILTYKPTNQ